ncbi:MAG: LLM class flavin-dependent oxidoreductase [Paracoccaceae bacterium]
MRHSILDLAPVPEGSDAGQALANTRDLAQRAEAMGYHRYWLAEHHNMPGIASAATALVIGHVAAATRTIRVGAGGIMLPNHSPLVIAEQFGTLATLYPGRIDLGLGRAPGTDMATARALRRHMSGEDTFPQDVVEVIEYFQTRPGAQIQAFPGEGTGVPVWILGSSLYGAQLAAYLGLPYAFASHFAPDFLEEAAETYRRTFRPSQFLSEPYFMMGMGVFAADTDDEAIYLRTSMQQAFARLRTGQPGKLPPPARDVDTQIPPEVRMGVSRALACSATGAPDSLRRAFKGWFERLHPDEVILASQIHSHEARIRSYQIAAEVLRDL